MDEPEIRETDPPPEERAPRKSRPDSPVSKRVKWSMDHPAPSRETDPPPEERLTPEEAELRSFLKEKCQHLVEGVPHQGDTRLLQDIYTDLYVTVGGSGGVNEEHEVRQILPYKFMAQSPMSIYEPWDIQAVSFSSRHAEEHEVRQIERTSMFYKKYSDMSDDEGKAESDDIEGEESSDDRPIKCSDILKSLRVHPQIGLWHHKPIRVVLTKGVAGIGKTVSVQKFILDWTEGETNQDIHLIFPLPFRELNLMKNTKLSLMQLIQHFFTQIKDTKVLCSSESKTLFIFDGLDECRLPLDFHCYPRCCDVTEPASVDVLLTNLINGNLLPSALVWITTRPAAAGRIPLECVDQVTEIRGFNDTQRDDYCKKRIIDDNLAMQVIRHIKSSRSLYIMCRIPVFAWILATVAERTSERGEMPRTLTQMYTHFLNIQTCIKKEKYTERKDTDEEMVLKLGNLAFQQLEKGNLIFYEEDLRENGIDVTEASLYSGVCTQIFRVEAGLCHGRVFSFVHLTIQEFLAALYVFLCLFNSARNKAHQHQPSYLSALFRAATLEDLHKTAVDLALQSRNGHLDLFLRFLLGLSLESNQKLLRHLLPQTKSQPESLGQTVQYVKHKIRHESESDRKINLFYCLNELNQHAVVERIDRSSGELSVEMLLPGQWETRKFRFELSEEQLDGFDLQKYIKTPGEDLTDLLSPDDVLKKLVPVVMSMATSAWLVDCYLTEKSCAAIAAAARSTYCSLKTLDLSLNKIHDTGIQHLSELLKNPKCKLETLELVDCYLTEKSCAAIAAAARSTSCSLKTLDVRLNQLHDTGVQHLSELLKDPQCKMETLEVDDPYDGGYYTLRREIPAAAAAAFSSSSHSSDAAELHLTHNTQQHPGAQMLSTHTPTDDGSGDDTQRGCESCAEVPDTSHWVLVKPEVSTEKSISTYSLSSAAGNYECLESSLRWSCVGPVTLQYRFMNWYIFTEELARMQCSPAGPLMDIKLMSGVLEEIHLPHFLCLGGSPSALKDAVKVLHQQDGGVCLETCELSRSHARLVNPSLSILGVLFSSLKSLLFPEIHTDVHVYRSSIPLTFRIYLMPTDAHLESLVEEQEKSEVFGGNRLPMPRPVDCLQLNQLYDLQTDCDSTIFPVKLKLTTGHTVPNFAVVRPKQSGDFRVTLLSSGEEVWRAEILEIEYLPPHQVRACASSRGPISAFPCGADTHTAVDQAMGWQEVQTPEYTTRVPQNNVDVADFLKRNRRDLIQRVTNVMQLADEMLSEDLINEEQYREIDTKPTDQSKMRCIYDALRSCGPPEKRLFFNILQDLHPSLLQELGWH